MEMILTFIAMLIVVISLMTITYTMVIGLILEQRYKWLVITAPLYVLLIVKITTTFLFIVSLLIEVLSLNFTNVQIDFINALTTTVTLIAIIGLVRWVIYTVQIQKDNNNGTQV